MDDYKAKHALLRKKYPNSAVHKLLIFGVPGADLLQGSKHIIPVLSSRLAPVTSLGTVMCDITTDLLAELAVLAITREMGTFKSPGLMELEHPVSAFHDGRSYNGTFTSGAQSNGGGSATSSHPHSPANSFSSMTTSRLKTGSISIGLNDRVKSRQHGRSKKYLAGLYLLTGRWQDALREFSEAATSLKSAHDYLWLASALEGIGICLLLLSFLEVPTAIPPVALQAANFSSHGSSLSFSDSTDSLTPTTSNSGTVPPSMFEFLPELTNAILRLYARSQGTQEESVPQVVFCETILRFVNLLTVTRLCGGWNPASLSAVVRGTPVGKNVTPDSPSVSAITSWINRAYSTDLSSLPIIAQCNIFSGIAVIYSNIGLVRKRSFVIREMLLTIIPRLTRARNLQAANAGIQSEGVSDVDKQIVHFIDGEREGGIVELLDNLSKVYGAGDITSVGYGWIQLRVSFLKTCLALCEAIPDYSGIIHFAGLLLSTSADVLSEKDQLQIYNTIIRAVESSRKLGQVYISAEFWDPNLLRDIKIVSTTSSILPQYRSKPTNSVGADDNNFFIHNPFAAKKLGSTRSSVDLSQQDPQQQSRILVQNERADFLVRLQNPFAFDLHVLEITLLTNDVPVSAFVTNISVASFSMTDITVPVIPQGTGALQISGASIQIAGCAKKDFLLTEQQAAAISDKIDAVGSNSGMGHNMKELYSLAKDTTVNIDVISAQPVMVLKNISINQGWMMLLEGEKQLLTITLANISDINANYVSLKFSDSTTPPLQVALSNKDLPQNEIYEVEYFLFNRKALQWIQGSEKQLSNDSTNLAALSPITKQTKPSDVTSHNAKVFNILVLGKRGMNQGTIQVEYANRDDSEDATAPFWFRTLSIPINITVNSSIELGGCDMMGLQDNQVFTDDPSVVCASSLSKYLNVLKDKGKLSEYCLLVVDLRNSWNQSIEVTLWSTPEPRSNDSFEVDVVPTDGDTEQDASSPSDKFIVKETIHAGKTTRLLIPVKRVEFTEEELARPIPSLSSNKRQFVVNANVNPERARSTRENFWYRNALLSMLGGAWRVVNGIPRSGILELRGIRLTQKMISILRVESVSISMSMAIDGSFDNNPISAASKPSATQYIVKSEDEYFTLRTSIRNRTSRPISGYLFIIPSQRYSDVPSPNSGLSANGTVSNNDVDNWTSMDSKVLYNGSLQQSVLNIGPGENATVELGALFMSRGEYEFTSIFDEFHVDRYEEEKEEELLRKKTEQLSVSEQQYDSSLEEQYKPRQHEQRDPVYIKVV